jgi:DNA polymerase-3 subunit alpha
MGRSTQQSNKEELIMSNFVNLHCHTTYGSFDSVLTVDRFIERLQELDQDTMVQTEHGTMRGMVKLATECQKNSIKYIPGIEAYIAHPDLQAAHLPLIAMNNTGLQSLYRIIWDSYKPERFYRKPRLFIDELSSYSEGLIALSGCLGGYLPYLIQKGIDPVKHLEKMLSIFGNNYYLELQLNSYPEQVAVNEQLIYISKQTGIPLVVTGDAHYGSKNEGQMREWHLKMRHGAMDDLEGEFYQSKDIYLRAREEAIAANIPLPAIDNTVRLANQCNVTLPLGKTLFPVPDVPKHFTGFPDPVKVMLKNAAYSGLKTKNLDTSPAHQQRLAYELDVIFQLNFESYFITLYNFLAWCKQSNIPYGKGRGSAAASLVCYCLDITGIDPLQYKLYFSRFLNKNRVSIPDIDLDFPDDRKHEIYDYLIQTYGEEHIGYIATYHSMKPKGMARDLGRMLNRKALGEEVAQLVPPSFQGFDLTMTELLIHVPELREAKYKSIIDKMMFLEGVVRQTGIHAAGIVISPVKLYEVAPVEYKKDEEKRVIQLSMDEIDKLGLVKFDALSLRNLTVIIEALKYIPELDNLDNIDYSDPAPWEALFHTPTLGGIFQFEVGAKATSLFKQLQPRSIEEVANITALCRPGPLASKMDVLYAENKENNWQPDPKNPLEQITKDTFGCILYQEQIIELCCNIAGFSEEHGDEIRRVMGKKKREEVEKWHPLFVEGCQRHSNLSKEAAEELFSYIAASSSYIFNKAHAIAYTYLSFQCAYLRHYYTIPFFTGLLNANIQDKAKKKKKNTGKLSLAIQTCKALGIPIYPPYIETLQDRCFPYKDGIQLGSRACKYISEGTAAVQHIKPEDRGNLFELFRQVRRSSFNKAKAIALAKTGALDGVAARSLLTRCGLIEALEYIYEYFKTVETKLENHSKWEERKRKRAEMEAQKAAGLLPAKTRLIAVGKEPSAPLLDLSPYTSISNDILQMSLWEYEIMQLHISSNPLSYMRYNDDEVTKLEYLSEEYKEVGNHINTVGIVYGFKEASSAQKKVRAEFNIEDEGISAQCIIFPSIYSKMKKKIETGTCIQVSGKIIEQSDETITIMVLSYNVLQKDRRNNSFDFEHKIKTNNLESTVRAIQENKSVVGVKILFDRFTFIT